MESGNICDPMLYDSILDGDLERVMHCLEHGGTFGLEGLTPLVAAAKNGDTDICGLLLAHDANVNEVEADSKMTALHCAAVAGNEPLVEALISWGAEVDAQDLEGRTPLYDACQEGHLACVVALLKAGASFNLPTKDTSKIFNLFATTSQILN